MRIARQKKIGVQSKSGNGYGRIGCDMAIYDEIVEIANECGLTFTEVTNSLLSYALDHSEIIEETKVQVVKHFRIGTDEELENDSDD